MSELLVTAKSNKPGSSEILLVSGSTPTGYKLHDWDLGNVAWELIWSGMRGTQGARLAGAIPQNRPLVIDLRVTGSGAAPADDLQARLLTLSTLGDELRQVGGRVTVRLKGGTHRFHFDVKAGTTSIADYDWAFLHKHTVIQRLEAICAPYLLGDPMDVTDDFSIDRLGEYTFDAQSSSDVPVTGGGGWLTALSNLTVEKRAVHTDYGYTYGDHQVTVKSTPGTTITSYKAGVVLKRIDKSNYLEVYVDDNGTNSRLRLDKVVAGARTNLSSTNLAARIVNGTEFYVRGRIEGDTVYLEHFSNATLGPSPAETPTTSASHTLAGGDVATFGAAARGAAGFVWTPQHALATFDDFALRAYCYRVRTLPDSIELRGAILGGGPALCNVTVTTPTSSSVASPFALIGWGPRPSSATGTPFGIREAETGTALSGWAVTADVDYRGGSGLQYTAAGVASISADFHIDPRLIVPDDYSDQLEIEVWARVELGAGLVGPRLIAEAVGIVNNVPTSEFGIAGKPLVVPSSGTRFRFVRVGTLRIPYASQDPSQIPSIRLTGTMLAGSTGTFGLDYVLLCRARDRALGPTGKPNDDNYPAFFKLFGFEHSRRIASDLSGQSLQFPNGEMDPAVVGDTGLGGSLIELPTGDINALVKLSSLVPDDPTADATSETLSHAVTVQFAVTPRWPLARTS